MFGHEANMYEKKEKRKSNQIEAHVFVFRKRLKVRPGKLKSAQKSFSMFFEFTEAEAQSEW